ncbi:type A chloramphenicol O-acetyltransferase [Bacillus cereus]|jgi:chloramphenicol O-acetyltransferase type A|uniref:Type A chloramphenicol O-acetyltransferase n=1 Tax=Bacillus cereus TaxID=1396 RepID=A0A9X6B5E5_BACCE|nr:MULTISPECIES: type A chloramphenicol O-acetyltransferase [Bacillus cereus group]AOM05482.1 Chloramphenicol acetyltransferase [Bacillus cereus]MBJ7951482.1 type A chloramphenicol O-acetyltransferase [Bacillus cereus]MBT0791372.1 type A chloramphenicol O-acetyltransferase [Bacillus cereus]MBX9155703.1 type A chloramphenicol O-acetyltransferase [Bacillus cereus]MCC2369167.1 type A chloramphenicol O-acetyltransferase [Bacillus cereus]
MKFHVIDREDWNRERYFEHYFKLKCTFSMTVNVDITMLLEEVYQKGIKFYPVFIYLISRVVNNHKKFRTCFNDEGVLGYWEEMIPSYTIFHKDDKSFSSIWTDYSGDFRTFYKNYEDDMRCYASVHGFFMKENIPPNVFPISSIPWTSFTGFNLNINNDENFLLPIITCGKYFNEGNKVMLPVSLQVHHSVCDGYDASKFIEDLQQLSNTCNDWLK